MITTDLYRLARRFIGLREVPGAVHNPQIMAMLKLDQSWPEGDETPWCAAFVSYIAWLLDLPRSKSLAARSWLKVGEPIDITEAIRGCDVVVFSRGNSPTAGHVAFFDRLDGPHVYVLGGNQSDSVSVARYPLLQVIGVRRIIYEGRQLAGAVGE